MEFKLWNLMYLFHESAFERKKVLTWVFHCDIIKESSGEIRKTPEDRI